MRGSEASLDPGLCVNGTKPTWVRWLRKQGHDWPDRLVAKRRGHSDVNCEMGYQVRTRTRSGHVAERNQRLRRGETSVLGETVVMLVVMCGVR